MPAPLHAEIVIVNVRGEALSAIVDEADTKVGGLYHVLHAEVAIINGRRQPFGDLQRWSPSSTTVGRPLDAIAVGVIAKVDVLYQRRRSTVSVHVDQSAPRLRVGSLGPSCDEESSVRHVAFWRGCWDGR